MSKLIPLTQGKFAIVDDEDYEELSKFKWYAKKSLYTFYAVRNDGKRPNRRKVFMHQQILNAQIGDEVDHRNHYGLDNRKDNIRFCSHSQNLQSQKCNKNASSQFKGVTWNKKARKWYSRITHNKILVYLGSFDNEVWAAVAYDQKAKKLFGEFANTNF